MRDVTSFKPFFYKMNGTIHALATHEYGRALICMDPNNIKIYVHNHPFAVSKRETRALSDSTNTTQNTEKKLNLFGELPRIGTDTLEAAPDTPLFTIEALEAAKGKYNYEAFRKVVVAQYLWYSSPDEWGEAKGGLGEYIEINDVQNFAMTVGRDRPWMVQELRDLRLFLNSKELYKRIRRTAQYLGKKALASWTTAVDTPP